MTAAPAIAARVLEQRAAVVARAASLPWPVVFLLAYLASITIIGKGPTYLGYPPLYWGEVVMAAGLVWIAPRKAGDLPVSAGRAAAAVLAYMALGAILTVPGIRRWGMDALRDAAIWYYGSFFFIGAGLARREALADRVWKLLRVFWMLALVWCTAYLLSDERLASLGPVLPWRNVTLFFNSTHESGQNLALGAVIVFCTGALARGQGLRIALALVAAAGLAALASAEGRGMKTGFAAGALVVCIIGLGRRPAMPFATRLTKLLACGLVLLLVLALFVPHLATKMQLDRFAKAVPSEAQGTARWRIIWWQRLYDAVMETSPLFGIGFGQSLHVYHPLLEGEEGEWVVRAPHNFNVTVFSRMGFAGAALWLAVLVTGIGGLCRRVWIGTAQGRRYSPERREELAFWVLMLVCTVVNSSFGVLMEGPVLGIWFWFALGFAVVRSMTPGARGQMPAPLAAALRRLLSEARALGAQ